MKLADFSIQGPGLRKSVRPTVQFESKGVTRPMANPLIKRYPNGTLDVRTIVFRIIDIIRRIKDYTRGGHGYGVILTQPEKALLSLVMDVPDVDPQLMYVHTNVSPQELEEIKNGVHASLGEMKAYAAGYGRGENPGARLTIDV